MCGIAGILALTGGRPAERAELAHMIGTLHHRGPDGFGYSQDGPIGLAHARLSIIDLSTGDQPIANEDRSVWTVFNGEISAAARRLGAAAVSIQVCGDDGLARALRRTQFVVRESRPFFAMVSERMRAKAGTAAWYVTQADEDI